MSKSFLLLALVGASSILSHSQSSPRADASAVWHVPGGFIANARSACGSPSASQFGDCVIQQMAKAGASPSIVSFTRKLFKQSNEEVGIMTSFQPGKPVDIAFVTYPWRSDHRYGLLLLNGRPEIVNVEDLKILDQKSMRQSFQYQDQQKRFAKVNIFPGDRDGKTWPDSQPGPNGGTQFVLNYPLRNGCATCANAGSAMFTWNFDKDGRFLGTSFMGLLPPPLSH